ncbi:MAG TPA: hypothetical protein VK983_04315, partial [Candidatus Limnocylindrales bacterium]|nr:hypothetical protein [Candidatus Limnocylindrales bacterium]
MHISNPQSQAVRSRLPLSTVQSTEVYKSLDKKLQRPSIRRRFVRYGLVAANLLIVVGVAAVVVVGQAGTQGSSVSTVNAAQAAGRLANPL